MVVYIESKETNEKRGEWSYVRDTFVPGEYNNDNNNK